MRRSDPVDGFRLAAAVTAAAVPARQL